MVEFQTTACAAAAAVMAYEARHASLICLQDENVPC